jgi:uncharacterized protein YaiI (UPF0178 family)
VLIIDAANVVGSRPTGWWRDRPGAARQLTARVRQAADRLPGPIVVVLEGKARDGMGAGTLDGVEVVHAPGSGDDTIALLAAGSDEPAVVVTADRGLAERVRRTGGDVVGPSWLLDRLDRIDGEA